MGTGEREPVASPALCVSPMARTGATTRGTIEVLACAAAAAAAAAALAGAPSKGAPRPLPRLTAYASAAAVGMPRGWAAVGRPSESPPG